MIDWHNSANWISDPDGYVFLPRAMLEIGKALYPNEWTGAEPTTPVFLSLPLGSAAARQWQKQEAHTALCKEHPEFGRKTLSVLPQFLTLTPGGGPSASGGPIIPPFTDAEWQAAREIYRRREDAARPAWLRYAQVKKTVTDACRRGRLAFGLRPHAGGAVYPGNAEWWETEYNTLHCRFEWFRMSSAAPFTTGLRDDADWICIARDSLDALLRRLGASHTGYAGLEPYVDRVEFDRLLGSHWEGPPSIAPSTTAPMQKAVNRSVGRRPDAKENALWEIRELFPQGIPSMKHAALVEAVNAKLKESLKPKVSSDTVSRAIGVRSNHRKTAN